MAKRMLMKKMGYTKKLSPKLATASMGYKNGGMVMKGKSK